MRGAWTMSWSLSWTMGRCATSRRTSWSSGPATPRSSPPCRARGRGARVVVLEAVVEGAAGRQQPLLRRHLPLRPRRPRPPAAAADRGGRPLGRPGDHRTLRARPLPGRHRPRLPGPLRPGAVPHAHRALLRDGGVDEGARASAGSWWSTSCSTRPRSPPASATRSRPAARCGPPTRASASCTTCSRPSSGPASRVIYDAPAHELLMSGSTCRGVRVRQGDRFVDLPARAVVLACGGLRVQPGDAPPLPGRGLGPGQGAGHALQHGHDADAGPGRRGRAGRPLGRRPRLAPRRPRPRRRRAVAHRPDEPLLLSLLPARQPGGGALRRRGRGRGLAHLRQDRLGDPAAARAPGPGSSSTSARCTCSSPATAPASRSRPTRSTAWPPSWASRRARWPRRWRPTTRRAVGVRTPARARRVAADDFDPFHKDGLATSGAAAGQVELGAAPRPAALRRLRGDLRDHVHLRRAGDRHRRPG